jgi:hypothetical protein
MTNSVLSLLNNICKKILGMITDLMHITNLLSDKSILIATVVISDFAFFAVVIL